MPLHELGEQVGLVRVIRVFLVKIGFWLGEVTEWPIVRHWKCRVGVKPHRGFESRPLRFPSSQQLFAYRGELNKPRPALKFGFLRASRRHTARLAAAPDFAPRSSGRSV